MHADVHLLFSLLYTKLLTVHLLLYDLILHLSLSTQQMDHFMSRNAQQAKCIAALGAHSRLPQTTDCHQTTRQ